MTGLDKWAILDGIKWDPHPGQLEIAESNARHRVASCGRRFGKSDLGGHELVPEAMLANGLKDQLLEQKKRREFWIVGPEYSDSEKEFRVLWNELTRLKVPFDKPGSYNDPIGGSLHISLWNGTFQVHGKSAKHPETLVGEGLHGVILAEAAKLKERVWVKYIRPTLADFNGWSLHTSTPEGKNWFHRNWQLGQDPKNTDWASWRMPSWTNPYVYKTLTNTKDIKRLRELQKLSERSTAELVKRYRLAIDPEIQSLVNDLTEPAFNQEIGADFTEFVGRVFADFDEEVHVHSLEYNPAWQTFGAVDYGYTNPNVWLLIQVGPWGEIHVLREFYQANLTAPEFADEIDRRNLCPTGTLKFYPDPASPADSRILSDKLKVPAGSGTGGELKHRLDAIRRALKTGPTHIGTDHPARQPLLKIDRSCTKMIYEMQEYRYPDKKEESSTLAQEQPMKKDDHTPEALGRFFAGFYGGPHSEAGTTRIRKARINA